MGIISAGLASAGASSLAGSAAASSGVGGGLASWLGGSSGGFSNAGLLGGGASLFGSLTGFLSERSQAKALKKAQDEQWKQQLVATRETYKQIGQEETAANKQFHSDILNNKVSLLQQQAQVELMAGASGTGGQSISSMLSDLSAQGGTNQANILDSHENQQINFTNQLKSVRSNNQMVMREFKKPSAFGALSKGISDMAGSYMSAAKTGKEFSKAYNDSRTYSSGVGS